MTKQFPNPNVYYTDTVSKRELDCMRKTAESYKELMDAHAKELDRAMELREKQEPVAYSYTSRITGAQGFSHHPMPRFIDSESWDIKPLYDHPPASKPLTDEEIDKLPWEPHEGNPMTFAEGLRHFARAIEAAHGIKE